LKKLIILGSARKNGETMKIVSKIIKLTNWELIDLNDYNITPYDYDNNNKNDDFIKLADSITDNYNVIIFATPVYWYSMSGIMKIFFDRLTDLLTIEKVIGRKLRGKSIAVLSNSGGDNLGDNFWIPFRKTAEYLGMNFITGIHTLNNKIENNKLNDFIERINKTT
jgi:multimeric flavodoxin WrbA